MKASKKYFRQDGAFHVVVVVETGLGPIRYISTNPQRAEQEFARLKGPFCPSEEFLLEEATSEFGSYVPVK